MQKIKIKNCNNVLTNVVVVLFTVEAVTCIRMFGDCLCLLGVLNHWLW